MIERDICPTKKGVLADVRAYIAHYNSRRLHKTLGNLTPSESEQCTYLTVQQD
ncbi:IS3 family transposase [Solemya velum gill symbiont]|uniref:IS3 family transposase n=1 Tax=Solemya velum gill symbiont TaxID=2340 RepID=UPI0015C30E63